MLKTTLCLLFLSLCFPVLGGAESMRPILVGQSSPFTGNAQNIGNEVRAGLQVAFAEVNDQGGVRQGRSIRLISRDDGYEPDKAAHNSEIFIDEDQVFALVGQVGTPTAKAVLPIAEQKNIPLFAPFTGAEFLRTPFNPNVINIRASYFQEMETLVSYLVDEKKYGRIACFYQNDSYGFDGLKGLQQALFHRGIDLVAEASYERNTVAVLGAVRDIAKAGPEAVVLVGAYAPCAEFIKLSKAKMNLQATFASISFVGTESLREVLGSYGKDVVVSQVVPSPYGEETPLVQRYNSAMSKYRHDMDVSFNSFEGYIAGKLFAEIVGNVPGELTRKAFVQTMEEIGQFDLDGLTLHFGSGDHQGLDEVFLVKIYPEIKEIGKHVFSESQ